jgi:aspartyl protease family protein
MRMAGRRPGVYVSAEQSLRTDTLPEHDGPWSVPPTPPNPAAPRHRNLRGLILWLALLGAGAAAYVALRLLFPGQLTAMDEADAIRLLGLLALVSSGLVFARRIRLGEAARNASIFVGALALILVGYSFRGELSQAFLRVRGELIPAYAVPVTPRSMVVTASSDGGFYVIGAVNGTPVKFVIDTGANGVLLSPADAARAGLDVDSLNFASPAETANGVGYFAPVTLSALAVGDMKLANVPAAVNKAPMSSSLLGMAFLRRLESFEVRGDQLTLKWKG